MSFTDTLKKLPALVLKKVSILQTGETVVRLLGVTEWETNEIPGNNTSIECAIIGQISRSALSKIIECRVP